MPSYLQYKTLAYHLYYANSLLTDLNHPGDSLGLMRLFGDLVAAAEGRISELPALTGPSGVRDSWPPDPPSHLSNRWYTASVYG